MRMMSGWTNVTDTTIAETMRCTVIVKETTTVRGKKKSVKLIQAIHLNAVAESVNILIAQQSRMSENTGGDAATVSIYRKRTRTPRRNGFAWT